MGPSYTPPEIEVGMITEWENKFSFGGFVTVPDFNS
jgi:hypothetical protein